MSSLPISQLPELTTGLDSYGEFPVSQGGVTYKVKTANFNQGRPFISAYNIPTQSGFTANTAYSISASTISANREINLTDGCKFQVNFGGTYNIQFSLQLQKSLGVTEDLDIWLSINNNNVSYSNTRVTMANNNDFLVAAWNFVVQLNDDDYVELKMNSNHGNTILYSLPAQTSPDRPAIPSAIITIVQV